MSSIDSGLSDAERRTLVAVARGSVEHGLREGRSLPVDASEHPPALRVPRATFVTLRIDGGLRGCTGRIEATQPLVVDVADSAYKSAFADPRFEVVSAAELPQLEIQVSVLSALERLGVESEQELVHLLRPKVDGLVLREGPIQSTFLPSVWDSIGDAQRFVRELKRKAGLPPEHWSPALECYRYTAESIA